MFLCIHIFIKYIGINIYLKLRLSFQNLTKVIKIYASRVQTEINLYAASISNFTTDKG